MIYVKYSIWVLDRSKKFLIFSNTCNQLWGPAGGYQGSFPEHKVLGCESDHSLLVPRLGIRVHVPLPSCHVRETPLLFVLLYQLFGLSLWSSGQSFWLQIQRSRVRFPALPDFLSSSASGTGCTQPREVNWGATWIKSSGSGPENRD